MTTRFGHPAPLPGLSGTFQGTSGIVKVPASAPLLTVLLQPEASDDQLARVTLSG